MSFSSRNRSQKDHQRALRAFAESGDKSESDNETELDLSKSTSKSLDLSLYIDALTQTQTQSEDASLNKGTGAPLYLSSDDDAGDSQERSIAKAQHENVDSEGDEDKVEVPETDLEDWSDENGESAFRAFKNRKVLKRKRAAAETNRLKSQKKSRAKGAKAVVGRKLPPRKKNEWGQRDFQSDSADENVDEETFLDEPVPDYITKRSQQLKRLHEAGLRLPPDYEGIEFSDSESEEKPIFHNAVKPQRKKKAINLRESEGVIPAPIAQWLRDYQVEGAQFLHERFVKQTGAILGDDMGLGKTIQVIAFLTAAFGKSGTKRDSKCMRKFRRNDDGKWYPRILIVCPGTLMRNWEEELEKWGWWQIYKYHGNPADRKGVLGAARKGMLEIMITTYHTYRNNESEINTIDWDCIIADECHTIKSKNAEITKAMNKANALCRIGLTGTAIQNKYEELWNLLNWARPAAYGSAQEWKQKISLPLKMGQAHDATNQQLADARTKAQELVKGILPSVFLRRMKSLIADQLPKKSDRVVFCQLTETQADAYRNFLESERCEFIRTAREPCDCESGKLRGWCCYVKVPSEDERWAAFMFPCMVTLQKLANHIGLILPVSTDHAEKQAKDEDTLRMACPDTWHELAKMKDMILVHSKREFCGKWKVLKRLLDFWHSNGDKVLIFSHSVRLLRLLKALFDLDGTKFNFSYLDGSMSYEERSQAVADFNSDPNQFVFLISTKAGGVGLNITSANKVVVVDPNWNPAYDLQAQDRAYRIGQTRDVEVFRLVSSGTIEEIVYARQIYKQQQANIGYTASDERRYFKGVMDESKKKGELFGLENLFTFEENEVLLRDIMHKTNVAETRAGVNAMDFQFDETQAESEDEDELLSNKSLGITEEDDNLVQMKRIAESFTSNNPAPDSKSTRGRKKYTKRTGPDPINAILAKAGVQYTHENSEVVGRSEVEARLGRQAMELRNDLDHARKKVFYTQSQSQSQHHHHHHHHHRNETNEDIEFSPDDHDDDDLRLVGGSTSGEFKINYRYRPDEKVRRRQFCSMAQSMGFEDAVEFALLVESCTQEERRRMLERFYRGRRREILGEWAGK